MQGKDSAMVPEQNGRGNECMLKNQMDTPISVIRFSSFLSALVLEKISICHHLPIQIKPLQVYQKRGSKRCDLFLLCTASVVVGFAPYRTAKVGDNSNSTLCRSTSSALCFPMTSVQTRRTQAYVLLLQNFITTYCRLGTTTKSTVKMALTRNS